MHICVVNLLEFFTFYVLLRGKAIKIKIEKAVFSCGVENGDIS